MSEEGVSWRGEEDSESQTDGLDKESQEAIDSVVQTDSSKGKGQVGNLREDPIEKGIPPEERYSEENDDGGKKPRKTSLDDVPQPQVQTVQQQAFRKAVGGLDGDTSKVIDSDSGWDRLAKLKYEQPESELEQLRILEDFLDEIDEELPIAKERERAGEYYQVTDRLNNEITTQSKLCFDYVENNGIIVDGDTYYGLQKVDPIRWESKDEEHKMNVISSYVTFLKALQWGIAIPCYPKAFDFTKYIWNIYETGAHEETQGVHPIVDFGRRKHISWTSDEIDPDKVRKKEFYVVTRVDKSVINRVLSGRGNVSVFGTIASWLKNLSSSKGEDEVEDACIDEVRDRQQAMKTELSRTGVEVKTITERQEAMELLYFYYNHVEPVLDKFEGGTVPETDFSEVM